MGRRRKIVGFMQYTNKTSCIVEESSICRDSNISFVVVGRHSIIDSSKPYLLIFASPPDALRWWRRRRFFACRRRHCIAVYGRYCIGEVDKLSFCRQCCGCLRRHRFYCRNRFCCYGRHCCCFFMLTGSTKSARLSIYFIVCTGFSLNNRSMLWSIVSSWPTAFRNARNNRSNDVETIGAMLKQ